MRGHLRKRGERSWSVVVDIGHDLTTGKRRQKWIGVKGTKRDAERKLPEVIRGLDVGSYVEPSRFTLGDYLDQWLADYVETSVRPRTAAGYRGLVGVVQKSLGQVRLTELSPQAVQRYYAKLLESGLSAHTVLHYHRLLSQALKQAVKWELLPRNVMDRVTPPKKVRPDFKILDMAGVERLLTGAAGTDYLVPIHLAVHTGLRRSELCGLRWSDLDLTAGEFDGSADHGWNAESRSRVLGAQVAAVPQGGGLRRGDCGVVTGASRVAFGPWPSRGHAGLRQG